MSHALLPSEAASESAPSRLPTWITSFWTHPWTQRIGIALLVFGACLYTYEEILEDRIFPKRFGVVVPGTFYRSGQIWPTLIKPTLEKYDIDVVVALTGEEETIEAQRAEAHAVHDLGLEFHRYPLTGDGRGEIEHYVQAVSTVRRCVLEGRTVLVHCAAGSQRTGGVTALYRLLFEHWPAESIVEEMEGYRWRRSRDSHMLDYFNEHMPYICERLVEEGLLDEVPTPLPSLELK